MVIAPEKVILVLHKVKKLCFGVKERRGREWEDYVLLLLQKGVDLCHAWETRPLDGVSEKVNMMHGFS